MYWKNEDLVHKANQRKLPRDDAARKNKMSLHVHNVLWPRRG